MKPYKALGYVVVDRTPGTRSLIFEHTLVAEKKIGRKLKPEEVVHHIDKNRSNNDPNNLIVFNNQASHILEHSSTKMKRLVIHDDGVHEWIRLPHICEICGKKFFRNNDNARFCSATCDGISKRVRETHVCPYCGKQFERVLTSDQEYCSTECYSKDKYHWIKDKCASCGKTFERPKSSLQRYCCPDCAPEQIQNIPKKLTIQVLLMHYSLKDAAKQLGVSETKMSKYRMLYAIPTKYHKLMENQRRLKTSK